METVTKPEEAKQADVYECVVCGLTQEDDDYDDECHQCGTVGQFYRVD